MGVNLREGVRFLRLEEDRDRIKGIAADIGERIAADVVRDGGRRVDTISASVYEKLFSRHRPAGVSPQAFTA